MAEYPITVWLRRSKSKGRYHTVVDYRGHTYSFCYMHSRTSDPKEERIVRVWNYTTQERLMDIGIGWGGSIMLNFVLPGLHEKYYGPDPIEEEDPHNIRT